MNCLEEKYQYIKKGIEQAEKGGYLHHYATFEIWEACYGDAENQLEVLRTNYFIGDSSEDCFIKARQYQDEWASEMMEKKQALKHGGLPILLNIKYITIIEVSLDDVATNLMSIYDKDKG